MAVIGGHPAAVIHPPGPASADPDAVGKVTALGGRREEAARLRRSTTGQALDVHSGDPPTCGVGLSDQFDDHRVCLGRGHRDRRLAVIAAIGDRGFLTRGAGVARAGRSPLPEGGSAPTHPGRPLAQPPQGQALRVADGEPCGALGARPSGGVGSAPEESPP
jgi:hypothetical protein